MEEAAQLPATNMDDQDQENLQTGLYLWINPAEEANMRVDDTRVVPTGKRLLENPEKKQFQISWPDKSVAYKTSLRLLMTMILALTSFSATVHVLGGTKHPYSRTAARWIMLLNSVVFIGSASSLMFMLRDFPWKPWPQFYLLTLFLSYVCFIMMVSSFTTEAWVLLFLGILSLLFAAAFGFNAEDATAHATAFV